MALSAANRRGIASMTIAMGFFVSNDAIVKFVSQSLPSAQLIFIRGVFASVFLLAVARHMGFIGGPNGHLRQLLIRPVLLRAAFDAVATMVYLTALFHLPLGNATAINLATPLFITLMAMLTLSERVGTARWLIISVGFAGVLLVVQPRGEGFNAWALLCVLGTFLHAVRDTLTRTIPASVPSVLITVSTALAVTLLSGLLSIPQGWKPVEASHLAMLAVAAVFLGAGYYLLINAMRTGEMSVIAPVSLQRPALRTGDWLPGVARGAQHAGLGLALHCWWARASQCCSPSAPATAQPWRRHQTDSSQSANAAIHRLRLLHRGHVAAGVNHHQF